MSASDRAPVPPSAGRPNLLLVVLDCARAKSFPGGPDGMDGMVARTPTLDRLAREGTRFPRAVAPSNWTIPSHMSFFTGAYPAHHGLRTFRAGAAPEETIASWLGRRGYETALFSEMVHLTGGYGLEEGFSERFGRKLGISDEERTVVNRLAGHADILYSERVRRLIGRLPPTIVPMNAFNHSQEVTYKREVCSEGTVTEFDGWLARRRSGSPFFAFVNFVDPHEPYPHVEDGAPVGLLSKWYARTPRYYLLAVEGLQEKVPWNYLLRGYLATLAEADRKVGLLLDALARRGELDRTLVVVTADHGQSFGESGNVYHGCGATESIARVPLVVRPPAGTSLPAHVDRWTSLCEIPSWLRSVASGRPPYDEEGHAPFPFRAAAPDDTVVYCEGAPASDPNRSLRGIGRDRSWNHRLLAAYRGREKYVLDLVTGELVGWEARGDLDARPGTAYDRRERDALRDELFGPYDAWEAERRARRPSDLERDVAPADVSGRLRSWGYG